MSIANISLSKPQNVHTPHISSIKAFAESNGVTSIPSTYHSTTEHRDDVADEFAVSIPIIDFSLVTSNDPQLHANAVRELGKACKEWGFFMITNSGISESFMKELIKKSLEFHNLDLEEKNEFFNEDLIAPIRYGTSALFPGHDKVHYWRDYLKCSTFPKFNFPHKPPGYKEIAFEYSRKVREVARNLLQGISESLGLEPNAIIEYTGYDDGFQTFQVNLYPPCPEPEHALGLPAHTDNGLLTLLTQNGIGGLQVMHHGKWVNVDPLPNSLLVNTGDQLEAVSNGRYKSILHRAVLNARDTRISLALGNGPALDKEVGPAPELLEKEEPLYKTLTYKEYFEVQQKARCSDRTGMDLIRINPPN